MMNGLLQKPPRGATIQPSHPFTKGLLVALLFNEGTGHALFNAAGRNLAPRQTQGTGGADQWVAGGYQFAPSSSNGNWFSVPVTGFPTIGAGPYTLAFMAAPVTSPSTYEYLFSLNSYAPGWGFTAGKLGLYHNSNIDLGATDWRNQGPHSFAIVRKSNTSNGLAGYVDGVQIGTGTHGTALSAPSYLRVGWDNFNTEFFAGMVWYFYFWDRALSPAEVRSLHQDPYGMFRPALADLPALAALVSGGAIQATALDGVSLGDAIQPRADYSATATDGMAAGDSMTKQATFQVGTHDGLSLGAALASTAVMAGLATDGANLGGVTAPDLKRIAQALDGITLAESLAVTALLGALASSGVSFGDLAAPEGMLISRQATDGIHIGEQALSRLAALAASQDGAILGETLQTAAQLVAGLVDGFKASDSTSYTAQGLLSALASDGVSLSDSLSTKLAALAQALDGISLQDGNAANARFVMEIQDAAQLGEAVAAIARLNAIAGDGLNLGDAVMLPSTSGDALYITFTGRAPGLEANAKQPGIVFEIRLPGITFRT